MDGKPSNPNPNSNSKQRQALYFLRALDRIKQGSTNPPSPPERSRRITRAAYASMAHAAGPGRVWSRALIRHRPGFRPSGFRRGSLLIHRRVRIARPRRTGEPRRADDLRRLVPGGESMDFCSLLEESANYVQFLATQVRLMQAFVDSATSPSKL